MKLSHLRLFCMLVMTFTAAVPRGGAELFDASEVVWNPLAIRQNGQHMNHRASGDGFSNGGEDRILGSSTHPDSDADGLPDGGEVHDFGDFNQGRDPDPDGDGMSNLQDYQGGTNSTQHTDSDGDGLPDAWEIQYGFNPRSGMSNLVVWYRFDEAVGSTLLNSAPGYSGVYTGRVLNMAITNWMVGPTGLTNDRALWFDGVDDYVAIAQTGGVSAVVTAAPFSISAWIWQDTNAPNVFGTVVSDGSWCGNPYFPGYVLRCHTNDNNIAFTAGSCTQVSYGVAANHWRERSGGRWMHIVAVCDEKRVQSLYVNGCSIASRVGPFEPWPNPELWIGRGHVNSGQESRWKGAIDDLRIYRGTLSGRDVADLAEAQGDADGDGLSNLQEYLQGTNPRDASPAAYTRDGALDIRFVPFGWATNSPWRYLAHFDDANSGCEIHLYVDPNDRLEFVIHDAEGQRHSIRYGPIDAQQGLMRNRFIINGITNRIVASWRNLNTGLSNASLRLFVNGVDWKDSCAENANPLMTVYNWRDTYNAYYYAEGTRLDFPVVLSTGTAIRASPLTGAYPILGSLISATVHTTAYGMVSREYPASCLPFEPALTKTPPVTFSRPQLIAQDITSFLPNAYHFWELPEAEWETLVRQYAQVLDGAEMRCYWRRWDPPTTWTNILRNIQKTVAAANAQGFDVALNHLDLWDRVMRLNTGLTAYAGYRLDVATNGCVSVVSVPFVTNVVGGPPYPSVLDWGNREAQSNYVAAVKEELSHYGQYSYLFCNEDVLIWTLYSFFDTPLYTTNALSWYREYLLARSTADCSNARFPISPVFFTSRTNTSPPYTENLYVADSATNLLVVTTDPEDWARWWEWRRVVLASLMHQLAEAAHEANVGNPHWKGVIYFISPATAWGTLCGVDMELLSRIPKLDWMIMENIRGSTYGMYREDREAEVRLQLHGLRNLLTNGTGFGSYVHLHTFGHSPSDYYEIKLHHTNGFTYSLFHLTQDVAYAASPEFNSHIIVPYNAPLLVDRNWTGQFEQATYVPEAAELWNRTRFEKLWLPITGHEPASGHTFGGTSVVFSWSWPEKAASFEMVFSTDPTFSTTNLCRRSASNAFVYWVPGEPLPPGTSIFWRVRGRYPVLHIADDGSITSTDYYSGAWYPTQAVSFVLQDADGDGMADAWETHHFGSTTASPGEDADSDGLTNLQEYQFGTNPYATDTDGDGLWDAAEVQVYFTDPLRSDTDQDGLSDAIELTVYRTDPRRPDTDGDGLPDEWEVSHAFNPTSAVRAVLWSPTIGPDPEPGQNNPGDRFDLSMEGGALSTTEQGGFGSFGQLYLNYDSSNLYLGAHGCLVVGSNNAMLIFLDVNTRLENAETLWACSGLPQGLDYLHNVSFSPPMDIAILLGDEYGDGTYPNFNLGDGYNFGQGVYYLAATSFVAVPGARLAQFDGTGTNATASADDDGDRLTERWECAIPWSSLSATGLSSLTSLSVAGLLASSSVGGPYGTDRYLSGNYLGIGAGGALNSVSNYGFNFVTLTACVVEVIGDDPDNDGLTNLQEYWRGTHPRDADSDDDGLTDGHEVAIWRTDPLSADSDADGLSDGYEVNPLGTDPLSADSDRDGLPDGWEVQYGFHPLSGVCTSLIAWWTFDARAGWTVSNAVSTQYWGTTYGMGYTNWIAGRMGNALWFDGAKGYVQAGTSGSIGLTGDMSAFAWIRVPSDVPATTRVGAIIGKFPQVPWFALEGHLNGRLRAVWYTFQPDLFATNFDMRDDQWHLVGFVRNVASNSIQMYIDGRPNTRGAAGSNYDYQWPLRLGGDFRATPGIPFHGALDEIRLYRRALSHEEVAALYEPWADIDGDGLINLTEYQISTSPTHADTDADGMPDGWELANGLNPLADDSLLDPDGDGHSNRQEFVAGTHPMNGSSVLRLGAHSLADSDQVVLRWPSVPGRSYAIQSATNLVESFLSVSNNIPATPPENTYTGFLDEVLRFYRIRVAH